MIERPAPLALGSLQGLPVPGRLDIADRELELHPTGGHTADGMALLIGWAGVLVAGDYLSAIEIPHRRTPAAASTPTCRRSSACRRCSAGSSTWSPATGR